MGKAMSRDWAGIIGIGGNVPPRLSTDTRMHLGTTLRAVYAESCDRQPITDTQVDLLLRLRHKERDRRRGE